ncbi:MAG: 50S ribosomal protein L17 [Acidimicrobiaceae bacterium]|nr:50S ribosomal protein L17 [Acidimicrobiaceae bacterium]
MVAKPRKGRRFGGSSQHQKLMMANLIASLIAADAQARYEDSDKTGGIVTTVAKAKTMRPIAEKLVTKARKGGVHNHRLVVKFLGDREMASELFSSIGPRYADRSGGYIRIIKIGPRSGDNAPMARIEFV